MLVVRVETEIAAVPERCFDLARSVDAHVASAGRSGERVVGGRTSGLLEPGDEVTWEGRHLGVRQRLTSRITAFDPPTYFQDRMIRGAFASFEHDHHFVAVGAGMTRMVDELRFTVPLGRLGWIVGRWIIAPHLRRFLTERGEALKAMAEGATSRDAS